MLAQIHKSYDYGLQFESNATYDGMNNLECHQTVCLRVEVYKQDYHYIYPVTKQIKLKEENNISQ